MPGIVGKVTAFVVRENGRGRDLLLFHHPNAGVQIPAGTVEAGESPEAAVLREAAEETGLAPLRILKSLGYADENCPPGNAIIATPTKVYARPDTTSFGWAHLRRGIAVRVRRQADGFSQVTYEEYDQVPDPSYVTMTITGWVPEGALANAKRRHFFLLGFDGQTGPQWDVPIDNHVFALFWAPLDSLPEIIYPQNLWLKFLTHQFPDTFG